MDKLDEFFLKNHDKDNRVKKITDLMLKDGMQLKQEGYSLSVISGYFLEYYGVSVKTGTIHKKLKRAIDRNNMTSSPFLESPMKSNKSCAVESVLADNDKSTVVDNYTKEFSADSLLESLSQEALCAKGFIRREKKYSSDDDDLEARIDLLEIQVEHIACESLDMRERIPSLKKDLELYYHYIYRYISESVIRGYFIDKLPISEIGKVHIGLYMAIKAKYINNFVAIHLEDADFLE